MNKKYKSYFLNIVNFFLSAFLAIGITYAFSLTVLDKVIRQITILFSGCSGTITTTDQYNNVISSDCTTNVPDPLFYLIFMVIMLAVFLITYKFFENKIKVLK